jgi:hypothetical protein
MVPCHQINCRLLPLSFLEPTFIAECPQQHLQLQEMTPKSRFLFSVSVGISFMDIMDGMLTSCIDAGGPQGISQLLILKDVMERLSKDESGDSQGTVKRPCQVFDMIGGVGTGGLVWFTFAFEIHNVLIENSRLIAIFLVVLEMTAKDALDEFTKFVVEVFKDISRDPRKQTEKLTRTINGILDRYRVAKDTELVPTSRPAASCKL